MKSDQLITADPILQRLNSVANSYPDRRVAARLYGAILPLVSDMVIHDAPLSLDQTKIKNCLESGVPVLAELDLVVDSQELVELFLQLTCAVESMYANPDRKRRWKIWQHTPDVHESDEHYECQALHAAAALIRRAHEDGLLDLGQILNFAVSGDYDSIVANTGKLQLNTELLRTLARNALKPVLRRCCGELIPFTAGLSWDKGICFVCGARATLGELRDNNQIKYLRCGECGADWYFNRLQCLHCGNTDHATQQYLYSDDCESSRIDACDKCHGYLKVITTFAPTLPEMLAVEDLATLHLDFIAQNKGYLKVAKLHSFRNLYPHTPYPIPLSGRSR